MHTLFEEYLDRIQAMHTEIGGAIEGLPVEALDWSPGPEMNSINVLAAHTAGSERFWISDVAGQTPTGRDRAAEFRVSGLDPAGIQRLLDGALETARGILQTTSLNDLDQARSTPRNERTVTVAWALLHALEHVAMHAGHIQLTAQLWRQHHTHAPDAR